MVNRVKNENETTNVGPLALPMPSPSAKVESREDGSLRIVDELPRAGLRRFWLQVADLIVTGVLEQPARVVLVIAGEEHATAIPEAFGRKAAAALVVGLAETDGETVEAAGFDLRCGCGVRVQVRS